MNIKSLKKLTLLVFAVMFFSFSASTVSLAGDVTMAPSFIPSFPMVAGDNVMIMWVPVPGAVKYKIFLDGKQVGEAPAPPFSTPAPADPGSYKYTLAGVDAAGEEGPASPAGVITIVKLEAPTGLTHRFLGETLNLRWDTSAAIKIFDIYRSEEKEGEYKLIASITETKYVDPEVLDNEEFYGKTYYYKLVGKDQQLKATPMSEVYAVAVVKPAVETEKKKLADPKLKIQRTKQVKFMKPIDPGTEIKKAVSLTFNDRGEAVFVDFSNVIVVLNKYGDRDRIIGSKGVEEDQYQYPTSLAKDEDGTMYIVDKGTARIMAYNSSEALMYAVPLHVPNREDFPVNSDPEEKRHYTRTNPRGIAVYGDTLYIIEMQVGAVGMYNKDDGSFKGYFKVAETGAVAFTSALAEIKIANGKMYGTIPLGRMVYVWDINTGELIFLIGKSKSFTGAFLGLTGINITPEGNVIVSDPEMSTVQVFSGETGEYLYHIGGKKAIPDPRSFGQRPFCRVLDKPGTLAYDNDGRLWVYIGAARGFTIRENVGDGIWDMTTDEPEGTVPKALTKD